MDSHHEVSIRKVEENELESVLEISKTLTLASINDSEKASQKGFLVSEFTLDDYKKFYNEAEYFYVAEIDNQIAGFLLAYKSESIKPKEVANSLLKYNLAEPFVLIKQIGTANEFLRQGVATQLYKYLLDIVDDRGFAAAIVNEPVNYSSINFHQVLGFNHLCNIMPPEDKDGMIRSRSIWYCGSKKNRKTQPNVRLSKVDSAGGIDQLMCKMDTAISLYNHEDNLNWTKFGMLISFMMALFAAFSFIWEKGDETIYLIMGGTVIVFGFLINYIFSEKIKSGLMFMQSHKEKAKFFENKLYWLNPELNPILNIENNKIAGTSKTVTLMQYIPIMSYIIWTGCSVLLVLKKFNVIS